MKKKSLGQVATDADARFMGHKPIGAFVIYGKRAANIASAVSREVRRRLKVATKDASRKLRGER